MSNMPDLTRLADTDVSVEAPRLDAGEPWTVTEIGGLQFYEYAKSDEMLGQVMPQAGDRLNIVRNPANQHDPNACEVWWRNAYLLGHLPRSLARDVAPLMDVGRPLRAYVYRPGSGAAWSMSALLVGGAVEPWHAVWVRRQVEKALADMERAERRQAHVGRDNAIRFGSRREKCRAARLQAAVNVFIRLPFEAKLPAVGSTVEVDVIASALDVSRTTVFRMARKAGVEPEISKRGWYSVSATVTVTAALHGALRAWCAEPRKRVTRDEIDAVIRRARDSHNTPPRPSHWDDEEDEIPF